MKAKQYIKNLFKRTIVAVILFFFICTMLKNDEVYLKYKDILFKSNIDFSYIKSKTNVLFGRLIGRTNKYVSSEKITYKSIEKIDNSFKLDVGNNYVINNIKNGTVIFIGEKEKLGTTVIINGNDGINYWYSNIENISVNLYDYIEESTILGSSKDNYIYLTFSKDEEYLGYEKFI